MNVKKSPKEEQFAFVKTDKSRIIEITEKEGKFSIVGEYVRIDVTNIPTARFAPKHNLATKAAKSLDDNNADNDPLTRGFRIPKEQVEEIALLIEGGAMKSADICTQVGISYPTFMAVFKRLKDLGRVDANMKAVKLGKESDN